MSVAFGVVTVVPCGSSEVRSTTAPERSRETGSSSKTSATACRAQRVWTPGEISMTTVGPSPAEITCPCRPDVVITQRPGSIDACAAAKVRC